MSIAWPTTSAPSLRPPSSGSEPAGAGAPAAGCANCGASLDGRYCGACGQRDLPLNPSARVLVGEIWDTFGSVDGKLLRTVGLLLTRPGALTAEHLRGRRSSFISPLKLYLTISAAYFAFAATTPDAGMSTLVRPRDRARLDSVLVADAERVARTHSRAVGVFVVGSARAVHDPVAAVHASTSALPRVMFALVPIFAFFVRGAYRRRGYRYPAHLYFALHAFAFYFAGSLVLHASAAYGYERWYAAGSKLLMVATLAYVAAAMHRVYGGRVWATAVRMTFVFVPFTIIFIVAAWLTMAISLGLR